MNFIKCNKVYLFFYDPIFLERSTMFNVMEIRKVSFTLSGVLLYKQTSLRCNGMVINKWFSLYMVLYSNITQTMIPDENS